MYRLTNLILEALETLCQAPTKRAAQSLTPAKEREVVPFLDRSTDLRGRSFDGYDLSWLYRSWLGRR
jgi:hypothetical protein